MNNEAIERDKTGCFSLKSNQIFFNLNSPMFKII